MLGISKVVFLALVLAIAISTTVGYQDNDFYQADYRARAVGRSYETPRVNGQVADLFARKSNLGARTYGENTPYNARNAFESFFRRDDGAVSCNDCCNKNKELANRIKGQSKNYTERLKTLTQNYATASGNLARNYLNDLKNLQNEINSNNNDPNRAKDLNHLINNIGNSITNNGWGQQRRRRRSVEKREAINIAEQPKCCYDNRCFLNCQCPMDQNNSQSNNNNQNNYQGNNNNNQNNYQGTNNNHNNYQGNNNNMDSYQGNNNNMDSYQGNNNNMNSYQGSNLNSYQGNNNNQNNYNDNNNNGYNNNGYNSNGYNSNGYDNQG